MFETCFDKLVLISYRVELLLEFFVGVVDTELLETVDLESLETVDVEHSDELVRLAGLPLQ